MQSALRGNNNHVEIILKRQKADRYTHFIALLPPSGAYTYCSCGDETSHTRGQTGLLQKQIHIHSFILIYTARKYILQIYSRPVK